MDTEQKFKVLKKIATELNEMNIRYAIGGLLLLYFKGITDVFQDIDLMVVEEDAEKTKACLCTMGKLQPAYLNSTYHTRHFYEFVIDGVDIDVMSDMIIVRDGKEYNCSLDADKITDFIDMDGVRIPLQSVSDWYQYYMWMGRDEKVEMIRRWM